MNQNIIDIWGRRKCKKPAKETEVDLSESDENEKRVSGKRIDNNTKCQRDIK